VFAATPFGIFTYDQENNEFQRRTKVNGLSDIGLSVLGKDPSSNRICIVYANSNVDIIDDNLVSNIPDILLKKTSSDKTINNVAWIGDYIYLSSNLGIIVINPAKNEIKETYRTGQTSQDEKVYQVSVLGNLLYAATENGLKKANFNSSTMNGIGAWSTEVDPILSAGKFDDLLVWDNHLIAQKGDSIFIKGSGVWSLFYASSNPISKLRISNHKLFMFQTDQDQSGIEIFATSNDSTHTLFSTNLSAPLDCKEADGVLWVADRLQGLLRFEGRNVQVNNPSSPDNIATGEAIYFNNSIWASAGSVSQDWQGKSTKGSVFQFDGNKWSTYNNQTNAELDSLPDIISLAGDLSSGDVFLGSFGGGLASINQSKVNVYKQNSPISPSLLLQDSYLVGGVCSDQENNIWVTNYGASNELLVKKPDGAWKNFNIPFQHADNAVSKVIVDASSYKWIISPKGNGLFCFDNAGTLDQTNDDRWRYFRQGKGNGNLPSSNVLSIASDRNGFLWVGTNRGVGIIQCGDNIFNTADCEALLPIVQQDAYAGLLFGEEPVYDIAVDGADRKWIATHHGVWLISADGQKVIYRFTKTNSPLLSDVVHHIVLNKENGEVFFLTDWGICSFRGTAIEPDVVKQKVIVFPNPVPSGYAGVIAVKGVPENSWVKITELDGRLVFQTRSLGGQAVWNGRSYKGEKITSGAYLIFISNESNTEQLATKIFFIK
jgi:streptogramin lyase